MAASIALASLDVEWGGIAVALDGQIVHPGPVAGYRVFNTSWEEGGRPETLLEERYNVEKNMRLFEEANSRMAKS